MLKRLRIRNYKSLRDVEVSLGRLAVLFGPNAAGKSNLLDALQLVSRIATNKTLKDAFSPPYRGSPLESFSFPPEGIPGLLRQESASFSVEIDVQLGSSVVDAVDRQIREMRKTREPDRDEEKKNVPRVTERYLRYRIEVEILPRTGILRVADEYLAALNESGEPTGRRKPFLELAPDNSLHLRMERQAHPFYYERYLDHSILSLPLYPPHYPHLVAMREELSRWLFFYFEPRERMRAPNPVKEVRHVGLMGEELAAYLNTLRALDAPRFKNVERALRQLIPSITGIEAGPNALGEVELRLLEGETAFPARVVSEGTLRLLGLLALEGVREPPSLVGFEEPENGIHPRRIELIARLLETRATDETQVIVTTHSPTLLDKLDNEHLYLLRRGEEGTVIEPFRPSGPLFRQRPMDEGLDESPATPISTRVLRGDFDA